MITLSITAVIWGMAPVAIRFLVKDLAPADILALRFAICGAAFVLLLTVIGGWQIAVADLPRLIVSALLGVSGYNLAVNFGYSTTPAGLGSLILGSEPIMIALFAALVLREALSRTVLAGMAISLAGLAVLMLTPVVPGNRTAGPTTSNVTGPLLVLLAAFSWSLSVVIQKQLLIRYGTVKTSAMVQVAGTPGIFAFASGKTLDLAAGLTAMQWLTLMFLALICTFLTSFTWNYGVKHVTAASAGAFIYCVPLFGVIFGIILLHEHLTLPIILGGILILTGVAIAQFGKG